ncbi:amidohydrolase family protein [Fulvivirga lutimaris]|uniref:amidohydrolase family protein n=1 Tax=Fulvivirga lutimaris TaxID=1819566 RepID=UPI0012BD6A7D|nr:amidohydrolase family protein [Fulvivirga lutimaris]MTI39298.1 amidohydrolase [Fulvivirga lutimaris]
MRSLHLIWGDFSFRYATYGSDVYWILTKLSYFRLMKKLSTLLLFTIFISCQNKHTEEVDLLLLNVNVVDVASGTIQQDQLVAVKGDTIAAVVSADNAANYSSTETIDATGKYVMPGLWDNHVHFRGGDSLIAENEVFLKMFLDFGITTVRDAGGDITPAVMEWRMQIAAGTMTGPTIFTSGPKLDGSKPAWAGSIKIDSVNDISPALDSLQSIGTDYVKLYDGNLTKEMFYEIIKAAESRGMKTTGHMPMSGDINTAIDLGLDGSEHLYYILKACSPLADSLTELGLGYGMMSTILETYNPKLAATIFKKLADNKVSVTPTLYIMKVLTELADTDHSADSLLTKIGDGVIATYQRRIEGAKRAKASGNTSRYEMRELVKTMMRPMYDAGVNIVAGSDCGASNSYVYPGESLIGELQQMVGMGLTPREALITSVVNGPKFFDLEVKYGAVEKGKIADLLILNANPLEDIDNVLEKAYLIKSGNLVE